MSEEPPECHANPGGFARAMAYIEEAQKRLLPERDVTYQQFLKVFADKATGKSSTEQVKTEIKVLLKDEPDLIEGFESFLSIKDQNKADDGSAELADGTVQ